MSLLPTSRALLAAAFTAAALIACSSTPAVPKPPPSSTADQPPEVDQEDDQIYKAGMEIVSTPPTRILVDGKDVGKSPVKVEGLMPGSHDVTFVDEVNGNVTMAVELAEGEFRKVHHALPPKASE